MLYVHKNGVGVVGLYPFSVAETKVAEVGSLAQQAEVPLLCTIEPDTGDGGTATTTTAGTTTAGTVTTSTDGAGRVTPSLPST